MGLAMGFGVPFPRRFCLGAAVVALAAAPALAQGGPRRLDFAKPPAVVAQMEFSSARIPAGGAGLFPVAGDPPLVEWLAGVRPRVSRAAENANGLDLAFELLSDDQRALAFGLEGWTKAAPNAERRRLRLAVAGAYAARDYRLFWREGGASSGHWSGAAVAVERRLRGAEEDALDLRAYDIPTTERGMAALADELAMSEAVAAYAMQARGARVDPSRISQLIGARPALPDIGAALAGVAAAGAGAAQALRAFNPPHYGYQLLRDKLVELRSQRALGEATSLIRVTEARAEAVADDGPPAGARSPRRKRAAASGGTSRLEAEVIANMERWRWLPRDMGEDRVEVNIPDFELAVVRDGEVAHRTRVIVGKEQTPTPVFSNAMQYIIVNPYWHVPPSIIRNEWGGDVSRAAAKGWKVSVRRGQVSVAQPPGEGNALGRIKFIFPNDFAVYMHDTPSRGLFGASHRAFSHGCMRVQEPFALAEAVLGPASGWSQARLRKLIGASERYINLDRPLPVHVEYFTAYVDEFGQLQTRGDLYGYSARVRRALGLGG
jgi:murein L,D-transpeptidase YcbB/YkuD